MQIGRYWPYGTFKVKYLDDRKFYDIEHDPYIDIYSYDEYLDGKINVLKASIPSEVVKSRYLRLFVTSWERFDPMLEKGYKKYNYPLEDQSTDLSSYYKVKDEADSLFNLVINDLFDVEVDGIIQTGLRWKATRHHKTFSKGYVTYIDLLNVSTHEHKLILYNNMIDRDDTIARIRWKELYFWKE